jgi:hypothetical protein
MVHVARWLSLLLVALYGLTLLWSGLDASPGTRADALPMLPSRFAASPWIVFAPAPLSPRWFWAGLAANFVLVALPFLPPITRRRSPSISQIPDDAAILSTDAVRPSTTLLGRAAGLLALACLLGCGLLLYRMSLQPAAPTTSEGISLVVAPLPVLGWIACLSGAILAWGVCAGSRRVAAGDPTTLGPFLGNVGALVRLVALAGVSALVLASAGEAAQMKTAKETAKAESERARRATGRPQLQGPGGGQRDNRGGRPRQGQPPPPAAKAKEMKAGPAPAS